MLKIKEKEPYIILPKQRYGLSTFEPHNVMSSDFTFFVDFTLDSEEIGKEFAIVARPGMHMGVMVKTLTEDYSLISWDFWTDIDGEKTWNSLNFDILGENQTLLNDRYFMFVRHDSINKKFTIYVDCEKLDKPFIQEKTYEGILVDYSETPYNIGCGNYSKVVPKRDRMFTPTTIYKLGLIANIDNTFEQILEFIENTKEDKTRLSQSMLDLVFYFNFNLTNIYKVWDLSGHCNFIQKNLFIEDEDIYINDDAFHKDYVQKS
jgi:hypothetical protein